MMMQMGMRELKENIGRFVSFIQRGDAVTLQYRGKPIAVVQPLIRTKPSSSREIKLLGELQRKGQILSGKGRISQRFRPIELGGRDISDIVLESRE